MRMIKWFAGLMLAWMIGSIPACGTMGGGGMKYLVEPSGAVAQNAHPYAG